ncbi:MAG: hypothetical protein QCI38_00515 [Candidatus Thermoplasmatota archaeon]|nr:hypothetical protein [Candidatus Thermoplasmatota archaeon]
MILVVSLSMDNPSLHDYEFVKPVKREVEKIGEALVVHHSELEVGHPLLSKSMGMVLCGTALGDNGILQSPNMQWLSSYRKPVLGICVGANLLSIVGGGGVEECLEIGMTQVTQTAEDPVLGKVDGEVYCLHSLAPLPPPDALIIAKSQSCIQAFKAGNRYGLLFHPEVRRGDMIGRFASMCIQ